MSAPHSQTLPPESVRRQVYAVCANRLLCAEAAPAGTARLSALYRGACHANQCHGSAQAALRAKQNAKALPSLWITLAAMHLARRS